MWKVTKKLCQCRVLKSVCTFCYCTVTTHTSVYTTTGDMDVVHIRTTTHACNFWVEHLCQYRVCPKFTPCADTVAHTHGCRNYESAFIQQPTASVENFLSHPKYLQFRRWSSCSTVLTLMLALLTDKITAEDELCFGTNSLDVLITASCSAPAVLSGYHKHQAGLWMMSNCLYEPVAFLNRPK